MIPLVFANRGTLDKLMGDAVMAIFGAPLQQPDHPDRAADCALQMVAGLKSLKSDSAENAVAMRIGVGINSGSAIVGNLGPVDIYELVGERAGCPPAVMENLRRYEKALAAYQAGDTAGALRLTDDLPDDGPTRWLIGRLTRAPEPRTGTSDPITDFHHK